MNQALALLILALQLLTTVKNTPNLPASYIAAANQIANIAIVDAEAQLSTSTTTPVVSDDTIQAITESATNSTPVAGSIGNMADIQTQPTLLVTPAYLFAPVSKANPLGLYAFKAYVLDGNGVQVPHAPISMTDPTGAVQNRTADTVDGIGGTNYYTTFLYSPVATGTVQFSFTSGSLTQATSLTI